MIDNDSTYLVKGKEGTSNPITAGLNNSVTVSDSGSSRDTEEFQAIQLAGSESTFALKSVSQDSYLNCVQPGGYAETGSRDAVYFNIVPVEKNSDLYTVQFGDEDLYLTEDSDNPGSRITFERKDTGQNSTKQKWKFVKSVTSK